MGWGTGNIGGGGASLNFKVVGGTTAPSNPKENTIWVNTSATITSYIFSATEPTSPTSGMVWITVGTSSSAEFNALKKNSIMVCPISAKQYVSGAWVKKTAMSYRGGEWVEWIVYLYKDGMLTAGKLIPVAKNWGGSGGVAPTITHNEKSISIKMPVRDQGYCYFEVKYDMTKFRTLKTIGTYAFNGVEKCGIAVLESVGGPFGNSFVAYQGDMAKDGYLDISSITGEKYIGFFFSYYTSLTVSEISLE